MTLNTNKKFQLNNIWHYTKVSDLAKGILISAIILAVFLFLLEHTIKYVFFIFGLSLAVILIFFVYKNDFRFKLNTPSPKLIDYFLVICQLVFWNRMEKYYFLLL